jgi:hypothetical protein
MPKRFLAALALAFATFAAPLAAYAAEPVSIRWDLSERAPERAVLHIRAWSGRNSSDSTFALPLADLQGLPSPGTNGPVRFRLVREAGRVDCDGTVADRRGSGDCRFTADAAFADALERRGVGHPTEREQLELTLRDVDLALVDEMQRQGYRPKPSDLVAAGIFRIDVPWLKALDAAGYRAGSIDKLVAMRIFRIEPEWIRDLASLGPNFRDLPADTLVAMRIHNVSVEFTRRMQAEYPGLTPSRLIELRLFGGRFPPGRRR